MDDAKLGLRRDRQSGRQTTHRALGTIKSDEDPGIASASGLVDQEDRALAKADHSLGRGAHEGLRIRALARGTHHDQIRLYANSFADDGAEWVSSAHDHTGRCFNALGSELRGFARKNRFRAV